METAKAATIIGTLGAGGGLTGIAIKYSSLFSSEESLQNETIPRVEPKLISKQEADNYKTKFQAWTGNNCNLRIKVKRQYFTVENFSGNKLDLVGLEQAWKDQEIEKICSLGETLDAEKKETGVWVFYKEKEAARLYVSEWSTENSCQIKLEDSKKAHEVNDISEMWILNDMRKYLESAQGDDKAKSICKQNSLLVFKKVRLYMTDSLEVK